MSIDAPAPTADDLEVLLGQVWASYVDAEPLAPAAAAAAGDGCWSAVTTVSGAWSGMITVQLSADAAGAAAALMLGAHDVAQEEIADAVGELVNMVGGNVKSLMPDPSVLSLPVVTIGTVALPSEAVEVARSDLSWRGLPVSAHVHLLGGSRP